MRNRRVFPFVFVIALATLVCAGAASAQDTEPGANAPFHFGPLSFAPSIALTNVGIDTNVFNDTVDPKQDQTGAIGPAVDLWLRVGRSRMQGRVVGQYLYFKQYDNQRALNTNDELKWEFPLGRLTPFLKGAYSNTKDRPGFEIDSRARLASDSLGLGTEVRFSGKTSLILSGTRSRIRFDDNQRFLGADLAKALNRESDVEQLQVRYKLTSLTTFVVDSEAIQDRFVGGDRLRNADSIKVLPGFEMKPSALVSGSVFVGYRQFHPLDATVNDFRGVVANVDATYTARSTQTAIRVNRDVQYSYQADQPYYTLTGFDLALTERITYTWDVVVRGGQQKLNYSRVELPGVETLPGQRDTIRLYGLGVGYRIGRTLRLGIDGTYYHRRSTDASLRDYEGARFGASVTYGPPQ